MDEPYDSSDPTQVRQRRKDAKYASDRRQEMLLAILSHEQGRDWLYALLSRCGVYANPFSSDALATAFRCGEQNMGQQLLADIMAANPVAYLEMLKEQGEKDGRSSNDASSGPEPGADASIN